MKKILPLILVFTNLFIIHTNAQNGSVGIGTSSPDPSSALHVHSVNKGFLTPRLSASDRSNIDAPANGLLVYDTDNNRFVYYNGDQWGPLGSHVSADTTITGIGTASQPLSLAQQGATAGEVLKWSENNGWTPANDSTIPNIWDETTDGICYSGNIGIGTCSPEASLDINSDSTTSDILLRGQPDDYIIGIDETESIFTIHGDSNEAQFALSPDGNTGIGTVSPESLLHIARDSGDAMYRMSSDNGDYIIGIDETESSLVIGTDNKTFMSFKDNGNAGIGSTDSSARLNVDGKIKSEELQLENDNGEDMTLSADSNDTSPLWRESIIDLYESSTYTIQTSYGDLAWDEQRFQPGNAFNHSSGDAIITIEADGYYRVVYNLSITNPTGSKGETRSRVVLDEGAGFNEVPGSHSFASNFSASNPKLSSIGGNFVIPLDSADRIKVQIKSSQSGLETMPNGCRLNVKKVAN